MGQGLEAACFQLRSESQSLGESICRSLHLFGKAMRKPKIYITGLLTSLYALYWVDAAFAHPGEE